MDRDAIERRDFPVGRRGYDPDAVHEHLRRVADEIEALRSDPGLRPARAPLSAGTSEHVRAILEAAETGAAEIRAQAGDHVARVEEATRDMLARLNGLETELARLLEALRQSGAQLDEGLAELRRRLGDVDSEPEPEPAPPADAPDPAAVNGDEAAARLVALNMALGGTPREETAAYLAERYDLADAETLLDDVYSRAGR